MPTGRNRCGIIAWAARDGRPGSVEPIAVVTDPAHVQVQHQKLLHFVATPRGRNEQMLAKVREQVVPKMNAARPDRSLESSTIRRFPSKAGIR